MSAQVFLLITNTLVICFVIAMPFIIIGIIKYLIRYYVRYKESFHEKDNK